MSDVAFESPRTTRTTVEAELARRLVTATRRWVPAETNGDLTLAGEKLILRDQEAIDIYAGVAREHDLREAWLGLACAHYLRSEVDQAAAMIGTALRRHAFPRDVVQLIDLVALAHGGPGWCSIDGAGELIIQLSRAPSPGTKPAATLQGRSLTLHAKRGGLRYTAQLPKGWERAAEIAVHLGSAPLLGSPIQIGPIVRVEGFVDSTDGDLHGWAWCPHDPERDPVLSIGPLNGKKLITAVANNRAMSIQHERPLAMPRGFRVPPDQLRRYSELMRVHGPNGEQLMGSPLDPSAERRGAERATRILAQLFPASGHHARPMPVELPFLAVPARAIGGPVVGGATRRPVDVVIPVYGGLELTLACLDAVLADMPRWARVIVVNDASPAPRVAVELGKLAAKRLILLLNQTVNRGFPTTANIGMRHDATRDIVLLNSDTLVPPGWLASLREAAYSARDIGTATPLSNAATVLSYPNVDLPNAIPDLPETIRLDALARRANAGNLVDIPTAVAFCTYIKRDCLRATGLLREDIFAQGYGEENDFCLRARHLGWRHVAVPGTFVTHIGGGTFGSRRHHLMARNLRMLNQLHPGYDTLIDEFRQTDPLAESRRRLDLERWKTFRTGAESVLLVTHRRHGGVRRRVAERAAALRAEGLRPILLWPVESQRGDGRDCVLGNGLEGDTPNLRFAIPGELELLTGLLRDDHPLRAEVHHMVGHDHRLMSLFRYLNIPYDIVVHDYAWLCPRINLMDGARRYCGEPELSGCEACVADAGSTNEEDIQPRALRERSATELSGAANVIVPSRDVAIRMRRYFPSIEPTVTRWEDDALPRPPNPRPMSADGMRLVCVIGAIGVEKGYDMLLACARDAAKRELPLRFRLVGHSCDDVRLLATGKVDITGEYKEHEVTALIQQQEARFAWLPSLWPETWCYTLTEAWRAGLNVLAFDIGSIPERIRESGRGWIVPLGLAPNRLNDVMMSLDVTAGPLAEARMPVMRR